MKTDWGLFWRVAALKAMWLLLMTVALMIPTGVDVWTSFFVNVTLMFSWLHFPLKAQPSQDDTK